MREIKFRAWDKENEYMISSKQGVFTALQYQINIVRQDNGYYNNGELLKPIKGKYILMQYTGLKDKNGKEIYEGDIVRVLGGCYEQGFYEINETNAIEDFVKDTYELMMIISQLGENSIEVIGNIYENKKLLEDR